MGKTTIERDSIMRGVDYGRQTTISLPHTTTMAGIVIYTVGDGTNGGSRTLTVNGIEIGKATFSSGGRTPLMAIVKPGDVISSDYPNSVWGTIKFYPFF